MPYSFPPLTSMGCGVITSTPTRRHRLARPRTPGSQPGDPGSNPGGAASSKENPILFNNGGSSNGRTPGSGPGSRGSNPCPPAILKSFFAFFLFLGLFIGPPLEAQPTSFEFMFPDSLVVDQPFTLRVNALTAQGYIDPNFQEPGVLWVIGPQRTDTVYVEPDTLSFWAGVAQVQLRVFLAGTLRLICATPTLTDTSPPFLVYPGPYARIQILWPGEVPDPGTAWGKQGSPNPAQYTTLDTVPFRVRLTDSYANPLDQTDSLQFSVQTLFGSLPFAQIPIRPEVVGEDTFWVQFRSAADSVWLVVQSRSFPQVQGWSAPLTILPDSIAWFLPVFPGEALLPGDTTTNADSTPGKAGSPAIQFLERPFTVQVYAVDAAFNPVQDLTPVQGHLVDIIGFDPYGGQSAQSDGPQSFQRQGQEFQVVCPYQGHYRFFVSDSTFPAYSTPWVTVVRVEARAGQLETWAEPTKISNGGVSKIYARVQSPSGNPMPGKTVFYTLLAGDGTLNPPEVETDLDGIAFSVYTASGFATGDTAWIQVHVDSLWDTVRVVVRGQRIRSDFEVYPNPVILSEGEILTIAYRLEVPQDQDLSKVKITILTPYGERVWEREIPVGQEGARLNELNFVTWDGKNGRGQTVASGMYDVFVSFYRGREIYRQFSRSVGVIR